LTLLPTEKYNTDADYRALADRILTAENATGKSIMLHLAPTGSAAEEQNTIEVQRSSRG